MTDRRQWTLAALGAAAVTLVARLITSRGRDEYAIWPDEPAQLAVARFIGGGTRWNMDDHSVWRPLFGTLLAPVYWFSDNPETVFHTALVLNAVLGASAAALMVLVARRLTPMSALWCAGCAVLVSLAPSVIFTTDFVFSESLVAPLFLATLLVLMRFQDAPTLGAGVVAGLSSGAAFATHSRMLPLAIISIGVVAYAAVQRRIPVRDAAGAVAVTVAATYSASVYTAYVVDRLWDQPSTRNSLGGVIDQMTNGVAVFVSLLGQTWYLLVASLGIVVYGTVVLIRSARRSNEQRGPSMSDARLVLVVVGVSFALSIIFMSDRWRSDQLVYGRYNDAVVTPVLLVGLATLLGSIPLRRLALTCGATAGAIVVGGIGLWALRDDVLSTSNGLEPMVLGLQPFMTSPTSIDLVRISVIAALATLVVGALAIAVDRRAPRRRTAVMFAASAYLVAVGWSRTATIIDAQWDDSGDMSAIADLRDSVLVDGQSVDFYLPPGSTSTNRMMAYQFHLPRTEFTVVNDQIDGATSPYVFARLRDDGFDEAGATLIWRDPRGRYGLWDR